MLALTELPLTAVLCGRYRPIWNSFTFRHCSVTRFNNYLIEHVEGASYILSRPINVKHLKNVDEPWTPFTLRPCFLTYTAPVVVDRAENTCNPWFVLEGVTGLGSVLISKLRPTNHRFSSANNSRANTCVSDGHSGSAKLNRHLIKMPSVLANDVLRRKLPSL